MSRTHIERVDLNLLVALDVLLEERNATRAADRLGLTQPAVSRILGRLRATFGDPLFARTSRGLTPTPRALALSGPLRDALARIDRVLLEQPDFDPASARRRYRISTVDYALATLLAPLAARLAGEAPRVELELRQPSAESERDLESGRLDLLVMPRQPSGPGIVWSQLYRDEYCCVVWRDHPLRRLTAARFAAMDHVLVAPRERAGGIVDDVLAVHGLTRRVVVQVPTFLVVPYLIGGTERIATVPRGIARELARAHPLRLVEPPIAIPGFTMHQAWHEIHRRDPGHEWLRKRLAEAARGLHGQRPAASGRDARNRFPDGRSAR
jgi:LysR family transcriptional regulator, nod-box dependent transcriptional activator